MEKAENVETKSQLEHGSKQSVVQDPDKAKENEVEDEEEKEEKEKEEEEDQEKQTRTGVEKTFLATRKLSDYFQNLGINPYKKTNDDESFIHRDRVAYKKNLDKVNEKRLRAIDKTTYSRKIKSRPIILEASATSIEGLKKDCNYVPEFDDYSFVLKMTKDQRIEKESLEDYIKKKREMFLLHYSVLVKKEEMNKLDAQTLEEEKKLEQAEMLLEEDALMFDEFLKDNDKSAGEAIKRAELEKKIKLEKDTELRALNNQIMVFKGEISKYEGQLKEYLIYEDFLTSLTPPEWLEQKALEKKNKKLEKGNDLSNDDEEEDEEAELYFTNPQQLLDIFSELEEQNLSLIQNSQETEETLEEMKQTYESTRNKLEQESNMLKDQISTLKAALERDEEEAHNLEATAQMYLDEGHRSEDEAVLAKLKKTVEEAYKSCIGEAEGNMTTLQMLTAIENRLEELFQQIDILPAHRIEAAMRVKEKERRQKQRELKLELQRQHQEERFKKAIERANAEPRKKFGRRLVVRSEPPQVKKTRHENQRMESKEDEEYTCFSLK